jgi:hypothetical protein
MLDMALDNALADHKTYGNVEMQHRLFARLRRESDSLDRARGLSSVLDRHEICRQHRDRAPGRSRHQCAAEEAPQYRVREQGSGGREWPPMLVRALSQMSRPRSIL